MRVCVIGGGMVGSALAYNLSKFDEADVVVVEPGSPGYLSTTVSFAAVTSSTAVSDREAEFTALAVASYEEVRDELGTSSWWHGGGAVIGSDFAPDIVERVAHLRDLGIEAEIMDAERATRELEPELRFCDPNLPVAFMPDAFAVDAGDLALELMTAAMERGTLCHFGSAAVGIEQTGSGFRVPLSDGSSVDADVVVNAAGAGADRVAETLGRTVPLTPTRGMVLRVQVDVSPVTRIVASGMVCVRGEGSTYLKVYDPYIDAEVMASGATRDDLVSRTWRETIEVIPSLGERGKVVASLAGVRPITADGRTWAGEVAEIPGYFELVSPGGVGLGPLLGKLIAREIVLGETNSLLSQLRPDRIMD
jgi:glycine/D-amino acid oxidase-like deaminating enzyme